MQLKVLTVCFGGEWKMKDDYCAYVGDLISKAFVIEDNMKLDVLRKMIMDRFNINTTTSDISLTHLHPFQKLKNPYVIDTEDDIKSFLDINEASQVSWTLPLYVSSSKMSENEPITDVAQNSIVRLQSDDSFQGADVEGNTVDVDCVDKNQLEMVQSSEEDEGNHLALPTNTDFLHVGQLFKSKHELINAVKNTAIRENFGYRVNKSSPELYKLKCVDAKCKWKMRASKLKGTDYFEIRRFSDQHTCSSDVRCANHCQPSYQIVGEKIKTRYEGVSKGPNPKMIRNDMQNEFDQNLSYWKAWKAQEWAQNLIRGTPEENYAMLPAYCHMLKEVNHGTYTCLEIDNYNRFKYVFVSIGASIRGFHLLRKVIMVDSTFLHGKYEGNLLIVTAQDGNQQIYPLAFAVVDFENDNSWAWFFQQLLHVVPCSDDLVFVSDQNLSIRNAVESVYISAKHVICMRQLKENLKSRFKDRGVYKLFTKAAESYTIKDFEEYFQTICSINAEMGNYLRDANFQKWSRAHCPSDRYNIMTTNNSESIDSFLNEARSYQIVALLEYIRDLLSRWFDERREKAETNNNQLPPNVEKILEARYKHSNRYDVKVLNNDQFEVVGGKFSGIVDLSQKTCSCKMFDLDHIPCVHAIAAIQHMKCKMTDFVSDYYKCHSWYKAYQEIIYPVPGKLFWVVPDDVINIECSPPLVDRKSGRPGKRKLPSVEEFTRNVIKKTIKCSNCGKSGHNRKTCPNKSSSSSSNVMQVE